MNALLLLPLIATAPVPKDLKPPHASLDGTWEFVAATFGGDRDASYDGAKWELRKDGTGVRRLRGDTGTAISYKADPKTGAFDWNVSGSSWMGIYKIERETMTVALSAGETRPTEFVGPSLYVFTMKKAK